MLAGMAHLAFGPQVFYIYYIDFQERATVALLLMASAYDDSAFITVLKAGIAVCTAVIVRGQDTPSDKGGSTIVGNPGMDKWPL